MNVDLFPGLLRAFCITDLRPFDGEDLRPYPAPPNIRDREIPESDPHPRSNSRRMVDLERVCLCLHLYTGRIELESKCSP